MIQERITTSMDFITNIKKYLINIHNDKIVFIIKDNQKPKCVIGPLEICGNVLGLIDEEYGWPYHINIYDINSPTDFLPGYRKHPFITDRNKHIAVSILYSEYKKIKSIITKNES